MSSSEALFVSGGDDLKHLQNVCLFMEIYLYLQLIVYHAVTYYCTGEYRR